MASSVCIYEPFQAKTPTLIGRPSHETWPAAADDDDNGYRLGGPVDEEKVSRLLICLVQFTLDSSPE